MLSFYFAYQNVLVVGWTLKKVLTYQSMALLTGCLAGLVGIGGLQGLFKRAFSTPMSLSLLPSLRP